MKPMLPTLTFEPPKGEEWVCEVKYDGFRAILLWENDSIQLMSRNGKDLLPQFPEVHQFLLALQEKAKPYLPITLDCELVILENKYKASFKHIQKRGRLRSEPKITTESKETPSRLLAFDVLRLAGDEVKKQPYESRKRRLLEFFKEMDFPCEPDPQNEAILQAIPPYSHFDEIWSSVKEYDGEGLVVKSAKSTWEEGKRSTNWLKYKHFKKVSCFITSYDKENGYFHIAVLKDGQPHSIGLFIFGLLPEEKKALVSVIKENKRTEDANKIVVEPGICLDIKYLELYDEALREPHFDQFRFDLTPEQCTWKQFQEKEVNLPESVEITHPDKPLFEALDINKRHYLYYLKQLSSYMLPFLKDRLLTVIRYPHGMFGEPFYQKNCPDYAPHFVQKHRADNIDYIVCNDIQTLIWLGNQLAFEFHIPFQPFHSAGPTEIAFDLDPPSRKEFHLAVKAALIIKEILDGLKLQSFVKTSGNKGLQIYIPLSANTFSYEDTRVFTSFIADYLITKEPESFTIERMKKNRHNRLYVDYIQHSEGKTLIAPYSVRGNEEALVSCPLYWDEVKEDLRPELFSLLTIKERIDTKGCPFSSFFHVQNDEPFSAVLEFLKGKVK